MSRKKSQKKITIRVIQAEGEMDKDFAPNLRRILGEFGFLTQATLDFDALETPAPAATKRSEAARKAAETKRKNKQVKNDRAAQSDVSPD